MSRVLSPRKQGVAEAKTQAVESLDYTSSSNSIIEFLAKEQDCGGLADPDPESIFQEVSRLSDSNDMRSVDELLQEAERLIQQQLRLGGIATDLDVGHAESSEPLAFRTNGGAGAGSVAGGDASSSSPPSASPHSSIRLNTRYTHRIEHVPAPLPPKTPVVNGNGGKARPRSGSKSSASPTSVAEMTPQMSGSTEGNGACTGAGFAAFVDNLPSESVISEESTPKDMDMENNTATLAQLELQSQENTDDDEDTVSETQFLFFFPFA
ncbi:hypothetical protein KR038_009019 [Drosophila bunnanda]|nr:hypothetical protein KR038_009019 [Drosophila bunnanda]